MKKPKQKRLWLRVVLFRTEPWLPWHIYSGTAQDHGERDRVARETFGPRNVRVRRVEVPTK